MDKPTPGHQYKQSLADRCMIHAEKMSGEGWHVTANVLAAAAEALGGSTMTANQFRVAIAKLGLSQEAAGEFMGRSPRQGQRWANGDPIPESVAKLLRLMVRLNLNPDDVA